jgi:hypothetical protein
MFLLNILFETWSIPWYDAVSWASSFQRFEREGLSLQEHRYEKFKYRNTLFVQFFNHRSLICFRRHWWRVLTFTYSILYRFRSRLEHVAIIWVLCLDSLSSVISLLSLIWFVGATASKYLLSDVDYQFYSKWAVPLDRNDRTTGARGFPYVTSPQSSEERDSQLYCTLWGSVRMMTILRGKQQVTFAN